MSRRFFTRETNNLILFTINVIYIFVIGLFDGLVNLDFIYYSTISLIYIISILTISDYGFRRYYIAAGMIVLTWLAHLLDMPILSHAAGIISTFFFLYVIVLMVIRIGRSSNVGMLEFLESINVYLLIGIAASVLFSTIYMYRPDSFNPVDYSFSRPADFIYYGFVTMTTLGFGDITPRGSLARSFSILFSVAGQLYLTMIIAMLVGKYLSQKNKD